MPQPLHRGRILCSTSNFPRWAGDSTTPFVLHLAQDLQALGWQVDVLAPHAPGAAYHEQLDGVRVARFRYLWPEYLQTVCYQGGALINLRRQPLNQLKLPPLIIAQIMAIRQRLRTTRYDLLHSHWILPQGFSGRLACWRLPLPQVITVHGGDVFGLRGKLLAHFKRAALNAAAAVTVNSSVTEQAVLALGAHCPRMVRIPMGVTTTAPDSIQQATAATLRQHYAPDQPLLLFSGRLVEEKGIADLLHALALLRPMALKPRLLIAGAGQDRPALEQLSDQLELQDQVHFIGWVEPAALVAYQLAADVVVAPSRTAANGWVEAQGLSVLEAMAVGTPVIASRCGGVVDAVAHEHTGLLVAEGQPLQLANAIARLLQDPALARQLSQAALIRVQQHYSRPASAEAFAGLFAEVMNTRLDV